MSDMTSDPTNPKYRPPAGHDKELSDSERAHSGVAGSRVRHGADALGRLTDGNYASQPAVVGDGHIGPVSTEGGFANKQGAVAPRFKKPDIFNPR